MNGVHVGLDVVSEGRKGKGMERKKALEIAGKGHLVEGMPGVDSGFKQWRSEEVDVLTEGMSICAKEEGAASLVAGGRNHIRLSNLVSKRRRR